MIVRGSVARDLLLSFARRSWTDPFPIREQLTQSDEKRRTAHHVDGHLQTNDTSSITPTDPDLLKPVNSGPLRLCTLRNTVRIDG
jgi:hypothetical protein